MCDFFPAFHPVSGFQRARQAVKLKDALERRKNDRRFPVFTNYPALLRLSECVCRIEKRTFICADFLRPFSGPGSTLFEVDGCMSHIAPSIESYTNKKV